MSQADPPMTRHEKVQTVLITVILVTLLFDLLAASACFVQVLTGR